MTTPQKKRFIAGATCPKCKSFDSIMLYRENNVEKIRCIHCDYQESQTDQQENSKSRSNEDIIGIFKPQ